MEKVLFVILMFVVMAILRTGNIVYAASIQTTFDLVATTYPTSHNSTPNTLLKLDPTTGQQLLFGNIGLTENVSALDWNQQTGRLYGISSGSIVEIDLSTGMSTPVASIQQGNNAVWLNSLAFAPNGTLYGWSHSNKEIGIIDLNALSFTSVFSTPLDVYFGAMDFSPSGDLYAVYAHSGATFSQTLVTINMETSTVLDEKMLGLYNVDDIDYAPDGFIYHTNYSHALFRIDPEVGQQILVGFGDDAIHGIASNPVPIPAAFWLLGSGLAGIVGIRLRRKKK